MKPEERLVVIEEPPLPDHPEVMIFVAFHGLPKQPTRVTMLSEMVSALSRILLFHNNYNYENLYGAVTRPYRYKVTSQKAN